MDAFDADVLIYASIPDHPLGRRVAALFSVVPVGSAVRRTGVWLGAPRARTAKQAPADETPPLSRRSADSSPGWTCGRLTRPSPPGRPFLAPSTSCARRTRRTWPQRSGWVAHRFITNNSKDFGKSIREIEITFPADLPDPG